MNPKRIKATAARLVPTLLTAVACLAFAAGAAHALDNGQCNDCHADQGIVQWSAEEKASNVVPGGPKKEPRVAGKFSGMSLHVDPEKYKTSVHGDLSCTDCHKDIRDLPHKASLALVNCSGCHPKAAAAYSKSSHVVAFGGRRVADPPRCVDCHGAHAVPAASAEESPVHFKNVAATCSRCHGVRSTGGRTFVSGTGPSGEYMTSVHHRAVAGKGSGEAATCVSCHGAHDLKDWRDPSSPLYPMNLAATCGNCHPEALDQYKDSVHASAMARGIPDAPDCGDCHGTHGVRGVKEVPFGTTGNPASSCVSCHASGKLGLRYGIATEQVKGYQESFHGLSARLGDRDAANCGSCHGSHAVFPASDPRSSIHPSNIPATCGKCHPGATENFAKGNVHAGPGGEGALVKKWVEGIYVWLILLVIGGMAAHNGLDFYRKMQEKYRERKASREAAYERLNLSERVQHFLTFSSFTVLAITGFALKYNWPVPLVPPEIGVGIRAWGHRIAALVMTLTSLYHVWYALSTPRGRGQLLRMLPLWKDAQDVWGTVLYFLGLAPHKPKFERFSYVEKAEYLALVWGTIVMILTGFLLWFEEQALRILPLWGLDVVNSIHYYEAILATLAIVVWHFYYVFVNPDFAPMSLTWIDGKLSRKLMEHEHSLELEEIDMYERSGKEPPPDVTRIVRGEAEPDGNDPKAPPKDGGQA